jgi:hypothetical protein
MCLLETDLGMENPKFDEVGSGFPNCQRSWKSGGGGHFAGLPQGRGQGNPAFDEPDLRIGRFTFP